MKARSNRQSAENEHSNQADIGRHGIPDEWCAGPGQFDHDDRSRHPQSPNICGKTTCLVMKARLQTRVKPAGLNYICNI
jgi:hypothetical protein